MSEGVKLTEWDRQVLANACGSMNPIPSVRDAAVPVLAKVILGLAAQEPKDERPTLKEIGEWLSKSAPENNKYCPPEHKWMPTLRLTIAAVEEFMRIWPENMSWVIRIRPCAISRTLSASSSAPGARDDTGRTETGRTCPRS